MFYVLFIDLNLCRCALLKKGFQSLIGAFSQFEARLKDHRRQVKKDLLRAQEEEEMMNLARDLSRRLRAADRRIVSFVESGELPPGRKLGNSI